VKPHFQIHLELAGAQPSTTRQLHVQEWRRGDRRFLVEAMRQ
jgi:hypothetical protein